jgi:purine-cytosine permease-like protein
VQAADVGPVPPEARRQSALDLFFVFAGANLVATTMVTGASLVPAFSSAQALALVVLGGLLGAAIVAALAPLGPRLGVPSVVAVRAALGHQGARALAAFLYLTNFAWIALNNVIAASACAQVAPGSERAWAVALGILSTAVVALGPRAVSRADRLAVPLMAMLGLLLLARCVVLARPGWGVPGDGSLSGMRGLDVVVGYQVSWILMFADYSRYTPSERKSALAVWLALGLTTLWFGSMGALAARAAGSADPGSMLAAAGLGGWGALLLALGTVCTNFVNIYLSALAFKSLLPRAPDRATVWSIGLIGAALALFERAWLDRYAGFMLLLGGVFVPVGGVLVARHVLRREPVDVAALYDARGPYRGINGRTLVAWGLGVVAYYAFARVGGTLPALVVSMAAMLALTRGDAAAASRSR